MDKPTRRTYFHQPYKILDLPDSYDPAHTPSQICYWQMPSAGCITHHIHDNTWYLSPNHRYSANNAYTHFEYSAVEAYGTLQDALRVLYAGLLSLKTMYTHIDSIHLSASHSRFRICRNRLPLAYPYRKTHTLSYWNHIQSLFIFYKHFILLNNIPQIYNIKPRTSVRGFGCGTRIRT